MILFEIIFRNRCWPTTFHTVTAGDADGYVKTSRCEHVMCSLQQMLPEISAPTRVLLTDKWSRPIKILRKSSVIKVTSVETLMFFASKLHLLKASSSYEIHFVQRMLPNRLPVSRKQITDTANPEL